jgi:hypothetical protein
MMKLNIGRTANTTACNVVLFLAGYCVKISIFDTVYHAHFSRNSRIFLLYATPVIIFVISWSVGKFLTILEEEGKYIYTQ